MTHLQTLCLAMIVACLFGCAGAGPSTVPTQHVYERWRTERSYYALLEIVDAGIDPWMHRNVTKADVRNELGPGIDDPNGYPNAGPNLWVYPSSRHVPYGSYLLVLFDDRGYVRSIDWVSE